MYFEICYSRPYVSMQKTKNEKKESLKEALDIPPAKQSLLFVSSSHRKLMAGKKTFTHARSILFP